MSENHYPNPDPWAPQPPAGQWPSQPDPAPPVWPGSTAPAQQWPAQPGPGRGGLRFASAHEAELSRRWRLSVGIAGLALGAVAAFYTFLNIDSVLRATAAIEAAGRFVPPSAMASAVTVIAVYAAVALAYVGVGLWNIMARRSASSGPVIATLVLAAVVTALIVLLLVRSAATGGVPQYGGILTNLLIIGRAVGVLRMKREPAYGQGL